MSVNNFEFLSREKFDELFRAYRNGLPENRRAKAVISQETYDQALRTFEDNGYKHPDPKFRPWVRKKFITMDIGDIKKLVCKKRQKPVCVVENLYDVIGTLHSALKHPGYRKTYSEVS